METPPPLDDGYRHWDPGRYAGGAQPWPPSATSFAARGLQAAHVRGRRGAPASAGLHGCCPRGLERPRAAAWTAPRPLLVSCARGRGRASRGPRRMGFWSPASEAFASGVRIPRANRGDSPRLQGRVSWCETLVIPSVTGAQGACAGTPGPDAEPLNPLIPWHCLSDGCVFCSCVVALRGPRRGW